MKIKKLMLIPLTGLMIGTLLITAAGCSVNEKSSAETDSSAMQQESKTEVNNSDETTDQSTNSQDTTVSGTSENGGPASDKPGNRKGGPGGGKGMKPGGGGGSVDKSGDTELQSMISEVQGKFTTSEYTDSETGLTVPYNIYLPEDYDSSKTYPMVVFIGDATTVGTDMDYSITQGWGGTVWATAAEQEKHEAIVLIPVFPETVIDDNNGENKSDYLTLIPRMITAAAEEYHADTNRIYGTGQSMGAMATLYTAANDPDLYAGILIVDGQWNTTELNGIETQNMVYIAAGGDQKASQGQEDVKALLESLGTTYSQADGWDAQASSDELDASSVKLLQEGNAINFITWEAGTVLNGQEGSEHMASFDYAYKLEKVRDWLFEQTR